MHIKITLSFSCYLVFKELMFKEQMFFEYRAVVRSYK
jgi:hypothetical protein